MVWQELPQHWLLPSAYGCLLLGCGVPLAAAGRYSLIAPTAAMTVHPVRVNGMVIGVSQTYDYFSRTQERVVRFITEHSRISRERLLDYMLRTGELANDVGSILSGQEAVAEGLIDSIGTLSDALAWLHGQGTKEPGTVYTDLP